MAKTCMINREAKRKKLIEKYASKRAQWRTIVRSHETSIEEKFQAQARLQALPLNSNACRARSRCAVTGRSRGVYRRFGLARSKLREFAMMGLIPGLRKSSW